MTLKIPERLRRFLAERDAPAAFERNVLRQRGGRAAIVDLESAFAWDITPEGFEYWSNLAEEYDRYTIADVLSKPYYGDDDGRAE